MPYASPRQLAQHLRTVARHQFAALQRDPRRQRAVSIVLAVIAALAYLLAVLNLQHTRDALGARSAVFVATHELRPGDIITAAVTRRVEHPTVFLAPSSLTDSPIGMTARQHVMPGEAFTTTNVHASERHVPPGWRVVAIAVRGALPPLDAGARVDVIVRAAVLVSDAIVVSVSDAAMVAVPADIAAVVATEAALGEATLAATG